MFKHKYISGFLFIFIWLFPFGVSAEELTDRVFIVFHNEIDEQLLDEQVVEVHHVIEELHTVSATISIDKKDDILASPSVKLIEDDPEVKITSQQENWGYHSLQIEKYKQTGLTGKGIKIGILDTGVRPDHPDLNISDGVTFVDGTTTYADDNGHGTHVAGIIASQDNDYGTIGVAPDAEIYAVKVLDSNGEGNQSDVIEGITWAMDHGMDLVNLSITSTSGSYPLQEILQKAYDQGILIVAASGNIIGNYYGEMDVLYPARYPSVIAVGSVQEELKRSGFSYYGQDLDFVAPGENIVSTFINFEGNDYILSSGTSMAAPFVTGMAALYKEAYPILSSIDIRKQMERSAMDLGNEGKDIEYGYGLIQPPSGLIVNVWPDVAEGSWYAEEVNNLYKQGIISGYPDGKFHPGRSITRAEAMTMIGRALKLPNEKGETAFWDVPKDHYATGYIISGTQEEIILGFPDQSFQPDTNIIRGDTALILQRAFKLPDSDEAFFEDIPLESIYFQAVNSLAALDIAKGYEDGTYKAGLPITRAEFSVLLSRALTLQ